MDQEVQTNHVTTSNPIPVAAPSGHDLFCLMVCGLGVELTARGCERDRRRQLG
jgi:hypothetical protein